MDGPEGFDRFERFEPAWLDGELRLVPEETKATRGAAGLPPALAGWVRLGLPLVREVVAADLDGDAAAQVRADAGRFRYHLIQLACSLRPPDGEAFRRAFLTVELGGGDATIAYALEPAGETVEAGRSTTLGITANLGLVSVSAGHERSSTRQIASVVAYDARTSHPSWELGRAGDRELIGSYHFAILSRTAVGTVARGQVGLSATVERWRLRRYEAAFPAGGAAAFDLEA
jgi:hypothetical protein